ncbi:HTH-type transcriptional regulator LutR [Burkholderia glumae]|uniref:FadR/GntR family transcriptional regulator n=1 Tax=Burkholderia glumae TaxID=337 RepID=UPI001373CA1A|nr:FCD domain-containing protein [Burkholderia glumae]MCR1770453.1 FadR family transcriptional regulator [Burkholderia glumae]QHP89754.1 FadR family transcriptional regulator [Burkholderia glumae]QKM47019.1 HTH-type transcriptional regulator LutR [Burkholderia glumae]
MEQTKDRSLVSKVMDGLVTGIVEDKYGGILPPQDVLSRDFDVSRTVMREALSMLLARDMLDVRPKVGTRVRPMRDWRMIDEDVVNWRFRAKPDPQFMRDVLEFRMLIEPRATGQAAERANAAEIAGIREAFEAFRMLEPGEANYDAADERLHARIVQASGNQFYQQMSAVVCGALRLVRAQAANREGNHERLVGLHERIVVAIEQRDAPAAEAAARELIDLTTEVPRQAPAQAHAGAVGVAG